MLKPFTKIKPAAPSN